MLKIREYGEFFASQGYLFAASNLHDDNWGLEESMNDIDLLIDWFENNEFHLKNEILLIGFSMGGRTAMHYAFREPSKISKIALLAPTQASKLTQENVDSIKDIPVKIWHGTKDVNIPFYSSQKYSEDFQKYSKEITLVPIEGSTHYDIETTLMKEILEFFHQ